MPGVIKVTNALDKTNYLVPIDGLQVKEAQPFLISPGPRDPTPAGLILRAGIPLWFQDGAQSEIFVPTAGSMRVTQNIDTIQEAINNVTKATKSIGEPAREQVGSGKSLKGGPIGFCPIP